MKHTYDEYDFERLYADVNDFSYESDHGYFQVVESCYPDTLRCFSCGTCNCSMQTQKHPAQFSK